MACAEFLFSKTSVLCRAFSKASSRLVRLKLLIIGRNGISTASSICNKYVTYLTSHNALR